MKFIKFNLSEWPLIGFFFLICFAVISDSQNLNAQTILPNYPRLPDAVKGQTFTDASPLLTFTYSDVGVTGIDWTMSTAPVSTGLDVNLITGALTGTVSLEIIPTMYTVAVTATEPSIPGGSATKNYGIFVRQLPSEVCDDQQQFAIILDLSGSMNIEITPGVSRWRELKNSVKDYLPVLEDYAGVGAEIGVIYFNGSTANKVIDEPFDSDWDLEEYIGTNVFGEDPTDAIPPSVNPGGGTPMGAGLVEALTNFFDPNKNKTIVLFTDGHQNGSLLFNIATETVGAHDLSDATLLNPDATGDPQPDLKILTIGIGGSYNALLQKVAFPDNFGFQHVAAATPTDMDIFFASTIPCFSK